MTTPHVKYKVFIAGASGETGRSITAQLLSLPDQFEVIALARPESTTKKEYQDFADRGATVVPVQIRDAGALQKIFTGASSTNDGGAHSHIYDSDHERRNNTIVISCLTLREKQGELALIEAASRAGVGRFVPSFWATVSPPRGVMDLRGAKEDLLDAVKQPYLPYTVIDVGWWYQSSLPRLPSGRLDAALPTPDSEFIGDGDVPSARIDIVDIGKFVARIITDPRTLNRSVLAYGAVKTQREIWDMFESLSGEQIPRDPVLSAEALEKILSSSREAIAKDPGDYKALVRVSMAQYKRSCGVRGDNTPQRARYLGYLDATELYPDIRVKQIEDYAREILEGKRTSTVYASNPGLATLLSNWLG